jgi:ribosomal protein S18 acetylase RimI-like enzyme
MTARLAALPKAAPGIEPVGDAMGWEGVPYGESVGQVAAMRGAWQVGVPGAARAVVHLGAGVAGLYDVGVATSQRRRGLGTAVTLAACAIARERGVRHVVLNATWDGEQLYRAMGFQSLGHGMTWWRSPARR